MPKRVIKDLKDLPAIQPKRKRGRPAKPRQGEMPLTGVGVEITTDKRLIELGEAFKDAKTDAKDARESLKKLDAEIQQRMNVIGVKCFRVDGDFWRIDEKRHVKVTKLKDPEIAALDAADTKGA